VGFDLNVLGWAAVLIVALTLIMRWVFAPSSRPRTGRPKSGPDADLGLLVPVLQGSPRTNALHAKDTLSRQGVRCSLSRRQQDSYDVLVFRHDLDRARGILGGN